MGISIFIAIIASLIWAIYRFIISPLLSPLSKIPNAHITSPVLPTWIWWKRRTGFEARFLLASHQRHGPIVRLAPHEVSVASLDGLRRVYGGGFERLPSHYEHFINFSTPSLLTMFRFESHSARKRLMSHVFSKSYLLASEDMAALSRELILQRFLPVVNAAVVAGTPVDVLPLFFAAGHDFLAAFAFGLRGGTDFVRNPDYTTRFLEISRVKLRDLPGRADAIREAEEHILGLCRAMEKDPSKEYNISDEPSDPSVPETASVLYSQLSAGLSNTGLTPERLRLEIAAEIFDAMEASREGLSTALVYLTHELSRAPQLQTSLRAELQTLSPNVSVAAAVPDGLPSSRNIDALPLLQAIVQETLRLHTPFPGPQPRVVPAGGAIVEGYFVPGGVHISTAARVLHLNEAVFEKPMEFRPERWLSDGLGKKEHDRVSGRNPAEMRRWLWAFSNGGKMCIGNHFSLQVIKLLVAAIYTDFTTTIVDDEGIEHRDSLIAGPVGDKLILQFHSAASDTC